MKSEWVKIEYETFYSTCYIKNQSLRRLIIYPIDFDIRKLPPFLKNIQVSKSITEILEILGGIDLSSLKKEIKKLKDENLNLKNKYNELLQENKNLKKKIKNKDVKIEQYKKTIHNFKDLNPNLRKSKSANYAHSLITKHNEHWKIFTEIIVDQLGVEASQIKPESSFIDTLGADSLDLVEIVMAFEDKYNIEIPAEDVEPLQTVGEAFEYGLKRLNII